MNGIPDHLNDQHYINVGKRNLLVFDDLMTEAKCDQRIANLFNNPIDRQQVATLARRIYPSSSATFMKRFERATSYPYGHLVIDLKSDIPEKDRLHTEIFDTVKTIDEKMAVEKGIIGTVYEEEEEEERGGLRKRRRSEEEEEEEAEEEEDTSVMRSEFPPGRRECQQLKEHTTVWLIALTEMVVFLDN